MARFILACGVILALVLACAPGRLQDQPAPPSAVTPGNLIPTVVPPASPSATSRTATPAPSGSGTAGDITVATPTGGVEVRSPVRVEGSARVFEGTVQIVVRDAKGEAVGRGTAAASAGAPERGGYATSVTYALTGGRQNGVVEVFSPSPRDGSPQSLVRVPVVLLPN